MNQLWLGVCTCLHPATKMVTFFTRMNLNGSNLIIVTVLIKIRKYSKKVGFITLVVVLLGDLPFANAKEVKFNVFFPF